MDRVEEWVEYVKDLSGGHEDPEPGHIYWAYNKYPTELGMSDFTKIREKYRVHERVRLIYPAKSDWPCNLLPGHIAMMADAFECRMRLPLHHFFKTDFFGHHLWLSSLSKIELEGLADKKIPPVVRRKTVDQE
ncbi:hypothetical protein Fot_41994 [Forsythia ovata]|uniref:Uncharacterized protein n=1 Tax=Forsythia ovata TaxID=205694 RepID=A0ABD1RJZ1_9LAMI